MGNAIVHFEIRSTDPDRSRDFYRSMFGWTYAEGQFDGHTYVEEATMHGGIRPTDGERGMVTVYADVDDVSAALDRAVELGGSIVEPPTELPNVTIGLFADPQGNVVGVASPRR